MLLNAYLFKVECISVQIWFFFQVVVYNLVGIPQEMWGAFEKMKMGENQKKIFKNIRSG